MMFAKARNNTCSTSLALACRAGDSTVVKSLLDAGRCFDEGDDRGWRAIHEAAAGNHEDCVNLLINHDKSDLNRKTFDGQTPLSVASEKGFPNIVRLLLQHGADPNICDNGKTSPLIYGVLTENASTITEYLVKAGAHVNHLDDSLYKETALHKFVRKGKDKSILQFLLDNGAQLDIQDGCGVMPVMSAAIERNKIFLELLLQHAKKVGKDSVIDLALIDDTTPLMIAASMKSLEIVELLLEKGADPNRTSFYNGTALHMAVKTGSLECVKVLAEKTNMAKLLSCTLDPLKSDVEFPSYDPDMRAVKEALAPISLLHAAVRWKRHQILSYFLASSFNPNVFQSICGPADDVFVELHSSHKCGVKEVSLLSALGLAVFENDLVSAKMLINAGSNVNSHHPDIAAPLTIAAYYGRTKLIQLLLEHGADPNYPNEPGLPKMCSLSLVAATKDSRSLRLILKAGGDGRLCCPGRDSGCPNGLEIFKSLHLSGHDVLQVISIYQEFHADKLKSSYLSTLRNSVLSAGATSFEQQRWKRVIEVAENPQPLASLCRMKVRECVMDNLAVSGTFITTLKSLGLPNRIMKYLCFESAD